ncbi:Hypothetical protein R9X50_00609800 [Acrodontium crateriforme]|uniref:FAD-binding PCMH-type domain-containing protein n=1 Tax=Acrodontium crateriforme TaxID=150365 RepID=A0AAQ3MAY9_9PEZI|nr:Hypothetical protein R9X50_00609800 [Acrodontium crateriforme]
MLGIRNTVVGLGWAVQLAAASTGAMSFQDLQDGWHAQLALNPEGGGCEEACAILSELHGDQVVAANTTLFAEHQTGYWATQQRNQAPTCFVQPTSADDVSTIIQVARLAECPFAVKSGGHSAFAGSANIQGGITILLKGLDEITVSDDKTVTRTGTGNRWIDVYENLQKRQLSVVGGRVAEIGTGGLTLGGGISFYSGRYGWACDNVVGYQVVTAEGEILEVDYESHPDLYWALRGGGNNFGIVTRLDLETFPQGPIWGGAFISNIEHSDALLDALTEFATHADQDPDAGTWVAIVYAEQMGWIASTQLTHIQGVAEPSIFQTFQSVPSIHSTLRTSNMTDLAWELNANCPNGLYETYWTATFHNSAELMHDIERYFRSEMQPFETRPGLVAACVFSPITVPMLSHMSKRGGNALGLDPADGPFNLLNLATMWADEADSAEIIAAHQRVVDWAVERATEKGLEHRFLYQNYAAEGQRVFESYGEENLERLKAVSLRYDPEQVFQRLQPGYFKL